MTIQTRINRQDPSLCSILSFLRLVTPIQSSLCLSVSAEVKMTGNFCCHTGFITCIIYSSKLNHNSAPLTAAASYIFKSSNKSIIQHSIPPTIPPSKPTIHPKTNQYIPLTMNYTFLEPQHCTQYDLHLLCTPPGRRPGTAEGGERRGRAGGIVFWDYLIICT